MLSNTLHLTVPEIRNFEEIHWETWEMETSTRNIFANAGEKLLSFVLLRSAFYRSSHFIFFGAKRVEKKGSGKKIVYESEKFTVKGVN